MLITCNYFDERDRELKRTSLNEIKRLEKEDRAEFLYRKERLFRDESMHIPMVLVRNGSHQGFRRKGNSGGALGDKSRGERESLTHQGNKETLLDIRKLDIRSGNISVTVYIEEAVPEKSIWCNGSRYEVDIYYRLSRTEPEEYYGIWNGELWVELFHTCKVDSKQAEDFAVENKALFEYKIPHNCSFFDNISEEGYERRKLSLRNRYEKQGLCGFLITNPRHESAWHWFKSKNGNMSCEINGYYFTVICSKYDENYGIVIGENKSIWEYNGKKFESKEVAMKNAEYIAFRLFNGESV